MSAARDSMVVGCAQDAVRVRAAAGWAHTWRSAVLAAWMAEVASSASIPLSLLERSVMVGFAWVTQRERWGGPPFRAERAAGAQVGRLPARPAGRPGRQRACISRQFIFQDHKLRKVTRRRHVRRPLRGDARHAARLRAAGVVLAAGQLHVEARQQELLQIAGRQEVRRPRAEGCAPRPPAHATPPQLAHSAVPRAPQAASSAGGGPTSRCQRWRAFAYARPPAALAHAHDASLKPHSPRTLTPHRSSSRTWHTKRGSRTGDDEEASEGHPRAQRVRMCDCLNSQHVL